MNRRSNSEPKPENNKAAQEPGRIEGQAELLAQKLTAEGAREGEEGASVGLQLPRQYLLDLYFVNEPIKI